MPSPTDARSEPRNRKIRHSIISSARANSDCGMVSPSIFAVLRLMTSSYVVGLMTGKSDGLFGEPLRDNALRQGQAALDSRCAAPSPGGLAQVCLLNPELPFILPNRDFFLPLFGRRTGFGWGDVRRHASILSLSSATRADNRFAGNVPIARTARRLPSQPAEDA